MAPRGRRRKPRLSRMDAAIDQMGQYGFPEELVCRRVKALLKVYGGDYGWPFIEENGYKVLIDNILDEPEEIEENLLLDMAPGDDRPGDNSVAADVGSSSRVRPRRCSGVMDSATQTIETEVRDILLAVVGDGQDQTDMALDQICNEKDMVDANGRGEEDSAQTMEIDNTPVQSSPSVVPSPMPNTDLPRRRKPCFGWISSDDEEEDFIKLIPAKSVPRPPGNGGSGMVKKQKRKTRWDVGPDDIAMDLSAASHT